MTNLLTGAAAVPPTVRARLLTMYFHSMTWRRKEVPFAENAEEKGSPWIHNLSLH
jgi:hypothetical protein